LSEAKMKIGILLTVNEYTIDPANLARKAEQLGFESLWFPDHAVMPVHSNTPLPETAPGKGDRGGCDDAFEGRDRRLPGA
jgi:hypothetical protein